MAARNDRRERAVPESDVKQVERGADIFVKLAVIGMVIYFVYLESTKPGSINILAWAFAFGAFFGKQAIERFFGGKS